MAVRIIRRDRANFAKIFSNSAASPAFAEIPYEDLRIER
jgi:hypothetical protein